MQYADCLDAICCKVANVCDKVVSIDILKERTIGTSKFCNYSTQNFGMNSSDIEFQAGLLLAQKKEVRMVSTSIQKMNSTKETNWIEMLRTTTSTCKRWA